MALTCPHCRNVIEAHELRRQPATGGGYECPLCRGMVRFVQPHAPFRRTIALTFSFIATVLIGARRPIAILAGTLLLWAPMSIPVNMYCVYKMPLGLKAWKQRGKKPFDSTVPELFDNHLK